MATPDTRAHGPLRLRILGPLRVSHGDGEPAAVTGQQASLLALLLAREGRPAGLHELVDLIWGEAAPASARNILHKYVGALRRVLEPALPVRATGSYLLRRGTGYLITAGPDVLDAAAFRRGVAAARAARHPGAALEAYAGALDLWRGPAGGGLGYGPAAAATFAALDSDFFDTCVAAAGVAVPLGRPHRVLRALRLAAATAPLHEPVQASLVVALAAAGQQAEALAVFGAVRERLAGELGIDPGPVLRAAHRQVLTGNPEPAAALPRTATLPRPAAALPPPAAVLALPAAAPLLPAADHSRVPVGEPLVGRAGELATLRHAVDAAGGGGTALVLVEGEPGSGKTRLLEEAAAEAARRGALAVWGRCLDGAGTPSLWPWSRAAGALLDALPAAARAGRPAGEIGRIVTPRDGVPAGPAMPDEGTRFRLFEQVTAVVAEAAADRPVLLVIDDLQWADPASLELFAHLAARRPPGSVLVGAVRERAPEAAPGLVRVLAAASRVPGQRRIRLGPLTPGEVAELVRHETGQDAGPAAARAVHGRTSGNPFFVRELARFLAGGGTITAAAAARPGVPSTVRDIVRDRTAALGDEAARLLRVAALLGRDVDPGLLAAAAGLDAATCLARADELIALGLLLPPAEQAPAPAGPRSLRFAHDLVREAVAGATPPALTARLHLAIAGALEEAGAEDEALAHHLWCAGPLADAARTAAALVRAGSHAAGKSALESAERWLRSAARVARTAGLAEAELSALSALVALAGMRSGYHGSEPAVMERAEHLARGLGHERQAAEFLFSRRAAHSQAARLQHSGRLARRLLDQGRASEDPVVRAYGLQAWGIHQWDVGNVGEAFRHLSRSAQTLADGPGRRREQPLRHDLRLMAAGMLAETTALHGDAGAARELLDRLEDTGGDPYTITVRASFAARIAALAGDPGRALHAAEQAIAEDPDFSYAFFGAYLRLARCWARALLGTDPAGAAAEAEALITTVLLDPPRSNLPTWSGLLAEMWLAAGRLDDAGRALDRADGFLRAHGQRYAEGLLLLLRARLMRARGEPAAAVRAAAEAARARSVAQEAHLFARRAGDFLALLDEEAAA